MENRDEMARTLEEIEAEALRLPQDDRARLVSTLLSSFHGGSGDDEIAQAWAEEALRRSQAMDEAEARGEEPGIPAEEVFRRIRATLR